MDQSVHRQYDCIVSYKKMRYVKSKSILVDRGFEYLARMRSKKSYQVTVGWIWTHLNWNADCLSRKPMVEVMNARGVSKKVHYIGVERLVKYFKVWMTYNR